MNSVSGISGAGAPPSAGCEPGMRHLPLSLLQNKSPFLYQDKASVNWKLVSAP